MHNFRVSIYQATPHLLPPLPDFEWLVNSRLLERHFIFPLLGTGTADPTRPVHRPPLANIVP